MGRKGKRGVCALKLSDHVLRGGKPVSYSLSPLHQFCWRNERGHDMLQYTTSKTRTHRQQKATDFPDSSEVPSPRSVSLKHSLHTQHSAKRPSTLRSRNESVLDIPESRSYAHIHKKTEQNKTNCSLATRAEERRVRHLPRRNPLVIILGVGVGVKRDRGEERV
jgi:hypothetical protein